MKCVKCEDAGTAVRIVLDDSEFESSIGTILCNDCYLSLIDTIWEMINEYS